MSLQGNLTDLPLEDLLQVFTVQNKSGVLFITHDSYQAEICFYKATLYSAVVYNTLVMDTYAGLQGEEAVFEVLRWPEGQFHFELESIPPLPRNIFKSPEYIILEFCRRRDERETEQQLEQLLNLRPCLLPEPSVESQINLELDQWRLLLQVDGQATINEIATRIRQDAVSTAKTFQELVKKGLLELKTPISVVTNYENQWQAGSNGDFYHTKAEISAKVELSYRYQTISYGNSPMPPMDAVYNNNSNVIVPQSYNLPAAVPSLPAGTMMQMPSNNYGYAALNSGENTVAKPKMRKGLLSGIVAKIRGL